MLKVKLIKEIKGYADRGPDRIGPYIRFVEVLDRIGTLYYLVGINLPSGEFENELTLQEALCGIRFSVFSDYAMALHYWTDLSERG